MQIISGLRQFNLIHFHQSGKGYVKGYYQTVGAVYRHSYDHKV